MVRLSSLRRQTRAGVLVEFALTGFMFLMVLISTVEWGIVLYGRMSLQRAAEAAVEKYALTRDETQAQQAAERVSPQIFGYCLQPMKLDLFFSSTVDFTDPSNGVAATGTSADNNAFMARLTLTCSWSYITPLLITALGKNVDYSVTTYRAMK